MLILPRHSATLPNGCWANIVDLDLGKLVQLDPVKLGEGKIPAPDRIENAQTRQVFATEAAQIAKATQTVIWKRPSRIEADAGSPSTPVPLFESAEDAQEATEIPVPSIVGSSERGIILHKLIEEVLIGEITVAELHRRSAELIAQLGLEPKGDPKDGISPAELGATVERTLNLPEIAQLRDRLVPEHTIFARETTSVDEILISGIADAVAPDGDGGIEAIVDWKSDVDPSQGTIAHYFKQIEEYRRHTGAKRALLVLMTPGKVIDVGYPLPDSCREVNSSGKIATCLPDRH